MPVSAERTLELPSRIQGLLNQRLGHRRADMWFHCASKVRVESGKLAVEAESSFAADWIRKNFGTDLRAAVDNAYAAVEKISWKDSFYRKDIAHRAL